MNISTGMSVFKKLLHMIGLQRALVMLLYANIGMAAGVTITINPTSATVPPGGAQTFTATVSGSKNTSVTWSVSTNGGTITTSGVYTAPLVVGSYTVTATSQADTTKKASAIVTVPITVQVSPSNPSVAPGGTLQFSASVVGTTNQSVTWTVSSGGGTINSNGLYTAPALAGSYTVTATSVQDVTKKGTTTVIVPITVSISPSVIVVNANANQQFVATITGTTNTSVKSWTTSGGKISSSGLFTAPSVGGFYTIKATSAANTSVYGTATVHVPININIFANPASIYPNSTTSVYVNVTGGSTNTIRWTTSGGVISGSGSPYTFTAPNQGGYFYLTATSIDDPYWHATLQVQVASLVSDLSIIKLNNSINLLAKFGGTASITPGIGNVFNGQVINTIPSGNTQYKMNITNADGSMDYRYATVRTLNSMGSFQAIQPLPVNPRQSCTLFDNKIFIMGNTQTGAPTVGLFDSTNNTYSTIQNTLVNNDFVYPSTVTSLVDGRALIISGHYFYNDSIDTTEHLTYYIYDRNSNILVSQASTLAMRYGHTATLLYDGTVLLAGGEVEPSGYVNVAVGRSSLVLFDPTTNKLSTIAYFPDAPRADHYSTLLLDGTVLITGGYWFIDDYDKPSPYDLTLPDGGIWGLIFDPVSKKFTHISELDGVMGTPHLLADGRVYFEQYGGTQGAVIWDPSARTVVQAMGAVGWHPFLDLPDGRNLGNDVSGMAIQDFSSGNAYTFDSDPNISTPNSAVSFAQKFQNGIILLRESMGSGTGDYLLSPILDVNLQPTSAAVKPGDSLQLTATAGNGSAITWSSSGGTVSSSGVFQAAKQGLYAVTATPAQGRPTTAWIRVLPNVVVAVQPSSIQVNPGSQTSFQAILKNDPIGTVTWSILEGAAGGSVDASGVYTAPLAAGTFHVVATSVTDPSQSSSAVVTVLPPLSISPTDFYTAYGVSRQFTATLRVSGVDTTILWSTTGGSINSTGLYTAPSTPGFYTVTATSNANPSWTASTHVTVQQAPSILSFTADATRVGPGGSTTLRWTVSGATSVYLPGVGYVSGSGSAQVSLSATTTYTLSASNTYGGVQQSITVIVSQVVSLSITPSNATLYVGQSITFGSSISSYGSTDVTWSASAGQITPNGLQASYVAPATPGTYSVQVTSVADPTLSAIATITVIPPAVTLSVTPAQVTLVTGGQYTFGSSIQVTGSNDLSVIWSAQAGSLVPKGGQVFYTAPLVPGVYVVTATSNANSSVNASSTVTVVSPNPTVGYLALAPSAASVAPGQRLYLGTYLVVSDPSPGLTWTASAGQLQVDASTASAFFIAPATLGPVTVTATSVANPSLTSTATIQVIAPTLGGITPSALTIGIGQSALFEAVDTNGNILASVQWTVQENAAGGSILPSGQYMAPFNTGTYHVIATNPVDGTQSTATVTVIDSGTGSGSSGGDGSTPTSQGVNVTPGIAQISAGNYQLLSAVVQGMDDQTVTWQVENSPSATNVDTTGVFMANQPGTYRVIATSVSDPSLTGSAIITVVSSVQAIPGAPTMGSLRGYSVSVLQDGRILIAGGFDGTNYSASAQVYDPALKTFTQIGSLNKARAWHEAALLADGRILISGGKGIYGTGTDFSGQIYSSEVFDPSTNQFTAVSSPMRGSHAGGFAVALGDGHLFVGGGNYSRYFESGWVGWYTDPISNYERWSDLFDPSTGTFEQGPQDPTTHYWLVGPNSFDTRHESQYAALQDGSILVTGGSIPPVVDSTDPLTGVQYTTANYHGYLLNEAWTYSVANGRQALPSMLVPRAGHTMTTLLDGRVLIVGGDSVMSYLTSPTDPSRDPQETRTSTATAEIYDPTTGTFTQTGNLNTGRTGHAAILLPTGKVFIVGGKTNNGDGTYSWPKTIEIFDPDTGQFFVMDTLSYGLDEPKLALAGDSSVLLMGVPQGVASTQSMIARNTMVAAPQFADGSSAPPTPPTPALSKVDNHLKVNVWYQKPMPQVDGLHFLSPKAGSTINAPLANCNVALVGGDGKELKSFTTNEKGELDIPMSESNAKIWMALPAKKRTLTIYPTYSDGSGLVLQVTDPSGSQTGFIQHAIPSFRTGTTADSADVTIGLGTNQVGSCFNILNTVSTIWNSYNKQWGATIFALPSSSIPILYDLSGTSSSGNITHFSMDGTYVTGGFNSSTTDPDGYDDPVLIHELGHFVGVMSSGGISVNPGGPHDPTKFSYDSNLAFDEGWASAFQSAFRQSTPDYAISPTLSYSYSFWDTNGYGKYKPPFPLNPDSLPNISDTGGVYGPYNEWSVFKFIWSIFNDPAVFNKNPKALMNAKINMSNVSMDFIDIFIFKQALLTLTNPDGSPFLNDLGKARVETLWSACGFPPTSTPLPMPYTRALAIALSTEVTAQILNPTKYGNRYQSLGYYDFIPKVNGDYTVVLKPSAPLPSGVSFIVETKPVGGGDGYVESESKSSPFSIKNCVANNHQLIRIQMEVATDNEPVNPSPITFSLTVLPPAAPTP